MKQYALLFTLCTNVTLAVEYPEITFAYDWRGRLIDLIGRMWYGLKVTDESHYQVAKQLPLFRAAWKRDAPRLFGEIVSTFKRGFKAKERTAILYLGDSWSYGSGWFLILGVSNLLEPDWKESSIAKEEVFTSILFHELLHIWLEEKSEM